MFSNPIIRRYRFSQFRPQQAWVFGALYVCIVLLILFINSSLYRYGDDVYGTLTHLYRGLFVQFSALELFLLWLLCPANCSTVVSREIADKSFDFFRMLPLSASQKAIGILTGRNLFCLLAAGVNLILCVVFAVGAGLSGGFIAQLLTVLAALTLALNLLSLLLSVLTYKKTKTTSIPVLLVIGLFAFGPVIGVLINSVNEHNLEISTAFLFTLEIPALYLISLCALYITLWAYIGTLRRFTYEYEAVISRTGAILFTLSFMAMLFGLLFRELTHGDTETAAVWFWLLSLIPVAIVPLFAIRSFDMSLEISRTAHRVEGLIGRLMAHSNIAGGLILFVFWLGFAAAVGITTQVDWMELLWLATMAFSFYLVILSLLETYALWVPKNEKIGYLLGFLAILYFVLPLVLGGIFDHEALYLFSPLGILGVFEGSFSAASLLMPILFNLFCLLPLGLLIGKRYYDLVAIRMQIADSSPQQSA